MEIHNILITSAGQRVSLVKAFQKELKKINPQNKVYTVDLNPDLSPACQISDGFFRVQKVTETDYIRNLLHICRDLKIKLIIPTIDTELLILSENQDLFLAEGIAPIVSSVEFVKKCRDKRIINRFFEEKGVEIPANIDKRNPTFPLFIKPYDGSLSKDIFTIRCAEDLNNYHLSNEKLMFMEYIDQEIYDEFTVDTYFDRNSHLKCIVPRKRILVRAGEINKGVTRKNELLNFIKKTLAHIDGAIGCLTMQFFFNAKTKRIVGIEINPRFGGGYPLSYLAGANFPAFLIKEYFFNETISYFEEWEDNLLMLRYDAEILVSGYEK